MQPLIQDSASPLLAPSADADTQLYTLGSGLRLVVLHRPYLHTATVAVFLRSGSAHESRPLNGISHVVEHMVFKGTALRDAHRINLDAEALGAEVNAHTDKDHSAFHMRGHAADAPAFVQMLADIVLQPTMPEAELTRERAVLLQELAEVEDDPAASAFRLFDRACFGSHAAAQTVIGPRANLERFQRHDLLDWMARQVTAPNLVVGIAGPQDPQQLARTVDAAFAGLRSGVANTVTPPIYHGGVATLRHPGSNQAHVVLGFPLPPLALEDTAGTLAAAVLGDGMSSPLMQALRERQALAYYAACSADVLNVCGQFVVEAACTAEPLPRLLDSVLTLLQRHAEQVDTVDLGRARQQLAVRWLRDDEDALRRLEAAALEVFARGRIRPRTERLQALHDTDAEAVRAAFARMLASGASVAITGDVPRGTRNAVRSLLQRQPWGQPRAGA